MTTTRFILRVSFSVLLIVETFAVPLKGSKSSQQSSSDGNVAANLASYQGASTRHSAPVLYNPGAVAAPVHVFVQDPSLTQLVAQTGSGVSGLSSAMPAVGYSVAPAPGVAVQAGYAAPAPGVAVQAGYAAPAPGVAVQAGYAAPAPLGAAQSGLPATQWAIAPTTFSEEASGDAQALGSSDFLPPAPQAPAGPVLQSGEISNVVKEAELGNYQQQREEFGYPSEEVSSGQGFTNMVAPGYGLGGFWGSPYPDFDYRLLNGLYPLGTYSTFSQNHEKGKDFSQVIHYLKEHASDEQGTGQQKKIFQGAS